MNIFAKNDLRRASLHCRIGLALPYLGIIFFIIFLIFLSFKREALNYGTETDFLGSFVPDAMRLLNREPLQVEFHPPFYSMILAFIYYLNGDWIKSGLILSMASSFIVMISCYVFFRLKFGRIIAVGAILALAVSETFTNYSIQATSDLFFMALFFSVLALIALAKVKNIIPAWFLAGILISTTILTRTNGIPLLGFTLFAINWENIKVSKMKPLMLLITGMLAPILIWSFFAIHSRSPIFPTSNHKNLALTYFSENRGHVSGDALLKASEGLTNTWQVLMKDPAHIAKTYIYDLRANTKRLFSEENLLPFPFIQLALPGLFILLCNRSNIFEKILLLNLLGMFLFLNFKTWENRFFLYAVPFMGAGITALLKLIYLEAKEKGENAILFTVVLSLIISFVISVQHIKHSATYHFSNLSLDSIEAAKILKNNSIPNNAIVIARKPHLKFYANLDSQRLPDVENIEDLKTSLEKKYRFAT